MQELISWILRNYGKEEELIVSSANGKQKFILTARPGLLQVANIAGRPVLRYFQEKDWACEIVNRYHDTPPNPKEIAKATDIVRRLLDVENHIQVIEKDYIFTLHGKTTVLL